MTYDEILDLIDKIERAKEEIEVLNLKAAIALINLSIKKLNHIKQGYQFKNSWRNIGGLDDIQ